MEKQQKSRIEKSKPIRIPIKSLKKLEKVGKGNPRYGVERVLEIYELAEKDSVKLLENELDKFADLVKTFLPGNHFEHYIESDMPRFLMCFIRTGRVDPNILWSKRKEKPIDEFQEKEVGKDGE